MKTEEQWLREYSYSHQNPINQRIHKVCVPSILFSVLGLLWHLQFPLPWWGNGLTVTVILGLIFYARLGLKPFFIMLVTLAVMGGIIVYLERGTTLPMFYIYIGIFAVAWVGQFIGHHYEGRKPSFFQDLQFLMIGPLWVYYH